mgnify:CR=1 FL=1
MITVLYSLMFLLDDQDLHMTFISSETASYVNHQHANFIPEDFNVLGDSALACWSGLINRIP